MYTTAGGEENRIKKKRFYIIKTNKWVKLSNQKANILRL